MSIKFGTRNLHKIYNAEKNGILKTGDKIDLEMSLKIKTAIQESIELIK